MPILIPNKRLNKGREAIVSVDGDTFITSILATLQQAYEDM